MVLQFRLLVLAGALALAAQPADVKKTALDKPTLEAYVRHLFVWGPQIKVDIADPKPSQIPGFLELSVVASAGNNSQSEIFYVSKDGQKILRGSVYDVAQNPFKPDLE